MTLRLSAAGHSDRGRVRAHNEDRVLIDQPRGVYLVVDGLGGQVAGERAAEVAISIIGMRLARRTGTPEARVREAFALASTEIFELQARDPALKGMACVATLALIEDDRVVVGHVGDSRLYLLEPGKMHKVTRDHSPVGEMEDAGQLGESAAMRHPRRNEVYRDLGSARHTPDDAAFVETHTFPLPERSALLLCSDGLTDQVPADEIRRIVEQHAGKPEAGALALIAAANDAGGKDNVSVILIETPQYATVAERSIPSTGARFGWTWFLAGLLAAMLSFAALRPYLEETTTGTRLRFGTVRPAHTWVVSANSIRTISEALDKARAGDTISVSPGEYHETVHLRSGVSLLSAEIYGAKISAPDVVVVAHGVHDARFSGFELVGPGEVGIRLVNSDVAVTDVRVSGMQRAGVEIEGGQPSLEASTVEGNGGIGVYVHGASSPRIDHNTISRNGFGPEQSPGLFIAGSATPHVSGNLISNNGAEQVWVSPFFNRRDLLTANEIAPTANGGEPNVKVVTR